MWDIDDWFAIDLFIWKNLWEGRYEVKLVSYAEKGEVEKEEIDVENILGILLYRKGRFWERLMSY